MRSRETDCQVQGLRIIRGKEVMLSILGFSMNDNMADYPPGTHDKLLAIDSMAMRKGVYRDIWFAFGDMSIADSRIGLIEVALQHLLNSFAKQSEEVVLLPGQDRLRLSEASWQKMVESAYSHYLREVYSLTTLDTFLVKDVDLVGYILALAERATSGFEVARNVLGTILDREELQNNPLEPSVN